MPASRFSSNGRNNYREPSPTPSEAEALREQLVDWKKFLDWREWAKAKYIIWYVVGAFTIALAVAIFVFHKQISTALRPAADWMFNLPGGWAIPIGILFVISFPPLFGHEIVAVLCGLVWGLGPGFGIVAAGTLLGEIGNFYAFKYICFARGEKAEKDNLMYACLARVVREGGFKIALMARLSAIPGHLTTGIFATLGMNIWVFTIAAILSMPKQFITVYIGVILEEADDPKKQSTQDATQSHIISYSVLAVTVLITIGAGWYIWRAVNRVRPAVILDRHRARKVKIGAFQSTDSIPSTGLIPRGKKSYDDDEVTLHEPIPRWSQTQDKSVDDDDSFEMETRRQEGYQPNDPYSQHRAQDVYGAGGAPPGRVQNPFAPSSQDLLQQSGRHQPRDLQYSDYKPHTHPDHTPAYSQPPPQGAYTYAMPSALMQQAQHGVSQQHQPPPAQPQRSPQYQQSYLPQHHQHPPQPFQDPGSQV